MNNVFELNSGFEELRQYVLSNRNCNLINYFRNEYDVPQKPSAFMDKSYPRIFTDFSDLKCFHYDHPILKEWIFSNLLFNYIKYDASLFCKNNNFLQI